jgi:hypothetical protein
MNRICMLWPVGRNQKERHFYLNSLNPVANHSNPNSNIIIIVAEFCFLGIRAEWMLPRIRRIAWWK